MDAGAAFRACLRDGDVEGMCAVWRQVYPDIPSPGSETEARVVLHRARTEAGFLEPAARMYSHRWLEERGLPSGLPAELQPKAEPSRIVSAVGIAVIASNSSRVEEAHALRSRLAVAVEEMYAAGDSDPEVVARRLAELRNRWSDAVRSR